VISHTDQPQEVSLIGHDLVADAAVTGALVLAPARWRWFARAEPRRCAAVPRRAARWSTLTRAAAGPYPHADYALPAQGGTA